MSHFESGSLTLDLVRYPEEGTSELQAWEAADEYLLQELAEHPINGPVIIFNDNFGALTCALHAHMPVSVTDSYVSQQALLKNMQRNGLASEPVILQDCMQPLPQNPALVVIKIPKTLALLEHQLLLLRTVITPETRVIAGAKARDIHTSTLNLFSKIIGETTTSLAWKKARLVFAQVESRPEIENPYPTTWVLENSGETIHNHANVFSRASLDIGARFFMQHLPVGIQGNIVDLGCGNGVVGLTALKQNPDAHVIFIDESYMAVESSRINIEDNYPQDLTRCEFSIGDSLQNIEANSIQSILCNPPFHQQQSVTDHIAWQMFRDAKLCLKKGGELRIIGNRHLGYHLKLRRLFGNCSTVAANQKFVILRAVKG
ncbi:MAG: 23S rRNA (guanine(1835)-N(2))-methyltransferase RlmG [Plesiomonas sp.]|uniref:23S rRNA (guanine(1835)-N(2))-methyltransferase RlmG n=1 Tax=Plesiomonas sp. TaxID=2486279 RepID=UPI003F3CE1B8